jgi:hypothetical protein
LTALYDDWPGCLVAAAFLGAALTACVQHASPGGPGAVAAVREELSPRFIALVGPKAQHAPPFLDIPETNFYCLRSFLDRQTGEVEHQLYVSDSYFGALRDWNAARDGAGRPLPFVHIGREEITCDGGCSYVEEFAVTLAESELRASRNGLTVIFLTRSGYTKSIVIPGERIAGQLAASDARRAAVPPKSALAEPLRPKRSAAHQTGVP